MTGFSAAYAPEDVAFLLEPIALAPTAVEEKERLIQSGARHYAEMISEESPPDARHLEIYRAALARGASRMARETVAMARRIEAKVRAGEAPTRIALCSLARAGVPLGVMLRRELAALGLDVAHFAVSIVRDRGLDAAAMAHVLARRPADGVIFVDGWTGKGAIAEELNRSWPEISGRPPRLAVLADPAGLADLSGSHEDWLIPFGILGAPVSGGLSRTILHPGVAQGAFHGCLRLDETAAGPISRGLVDRVTAEARALRGAPLEISEDDAAARGRRRAAARATVDGLARRFGVADRNRIKPGIAEATRAVLRRRPDRVLLRDPADPDLDLLVHLCRRDGVPTETLGTDLGPYRAVTLIERHGR